jgi:CRISPR-associated endoribonuclease Cas6
MRIKIVFRGKAGRLSINYNYGLTGLIYNFLSNSSTDYSKFLLDQGYVLGKRHFKLFAFSNLFLKDVTLKGRRLSLMKPR